MLENRILQVLDQSKLKRQEFVERIGISNSVLSHLISGRNKASLELVVKILHEFPAIDPQWLLSGIGEMYKRVGPNQDRTILEWQIAAIELLLKQNDEFRVKLEDVYRSLNELRSESE